MAVRQQETPAFASFLFGGGCLALAWYLWPQGRTYWQHWGMVYMAAGAGGLLLLSGTLKLWRDIRNRRARAAAMRPSGVYGRAAFASLADCAQGGLTDDQGLFLGALDNRPLFYSGKAHLLTVAPARQGKGVAVVIPNLLHWQGSALVTDPKGELAGATSRHRAERFGQDVFILNPWGLHGLPQHRLNPLQPLLDMYADPAAQRGVMEEAQALALQLVPEGNDDKNKFFRAGERKLLLGLLLHLVTRGEDDRCTLVELWRVLQNTRRLRELIADMAVSDALSGAVADLAEDLIQTAEDTPEHFGGFRQGASQAVSIFDPSGWLGDCVSGSDFSLQQLRQRPTTVYLVIPQERVETHGMWLGLVTKQAITAAARAAAPSASPVLFLLDEFANMGKLAGLTEALTALPGLGVRVWAIVQELADLRRIYGDNAAQTILSQAEVKQYFAVQNDRLAQEISKALGTQTVKTMNYGLGQRPTDELRPSVGESGRPLLSADEIRMLPNDPKRGRGKQLLFIQSLPPIKADRVPYWEVDPWRDWVDPNPVEGPPPRTTPIVRIRYRNH